METKLNKIYVNKIQPLFDFIDKQLNAIGHKIFKYNSAICFKDLFYCILCANKNKDSSYSKAINSALIDGIINVTKSAIITKRTKCKSSYFQQLNRDVINFIYSDVDYRLLATDGTIFYVDIKLVDEKIPKSSNNNCCKIKMNAIHDVERKIPISYQLCNETDERALLRSQFSELHEGDIVVHDGGYYSEEIFNMYVVNKIDTIFKLKKTTDSLFCKRKKYDFIIKKYFPKIKCHHKIRYIKFYTDNGNGKRATYLCTTLINTHTRDEIISMYRKRWEIETHFRYSKYDISLNDIKSKSVNNIQQDVYINQFISIISSYIEFLLTPLIDKPNNQNTHCSKINTACCIDLIKNNLIKVMLYISHTSNSHYLFLKIASVLIKSPIIAEKNRHYERVRKKPRLKWSITGSSSHRPHKGKRVSVDKTNKGIRIPVIDFCNINGEKNNDYG
jgi:hypothetical protein